MFFRRQSSTPEQPAVPSAVELPHMPNIKQDTISPCKDLRKHAAQWKHALSDASDAVIRSFTNQNGKLFCAVIYIDGLVDKEMIQFHVLEPVTHTALTETGDVLPSLTLSVITAADVKVTNQIESAWQMLLSGETLLLLEGTEDLYIISTRKPAMRSVEAPMSENLVQGPREGFTETLRVNLALIRRRMRDPVLATEAFTVGKRSHTDVVMAYLKEIAPQKIVDTIRERINAVEIDVLLESGQLEQLIEDDPISPFSQLQNTERPDKAAAALAEGRVVLLVDGTPFVLIAPAGFNQMMQTPEDYYSRWHIASFVRLMRWIAVIVTTFAPALYVALVSFHSNLLPTKLVLALVSGRKSVPFPAIVEALMFAFVLELLREAGLRLTKAIGSTVGVVGGILIGEALYQSGLANPFLVVVMSVTAISNFIIPAYNVGISLRLLQYPIMLLAAVMGLYGIGLSVFVLLTHLVTLQSFGMPYLSPFAPFRSNEMRDALVRLPSHTLTPSENDWYMGGK